MTCREPGTPLRIPSNPTDVVGIDPCPPSRPSPPRCRGWSGACTSTSAGSGPPPVADGAPALPAAHVYTPRLTVMNTYRVDGRGLVRTGTEEAGVDW
jgi:hypothetical protein